MPGRVFISCGQRQGERETAQAVSRWFTSQGFQPYVALEAQSIQDVNAWIIGELRRSDYYVLIDFRREPVTLPRHKKVHRGSVFSYQELAIAYALGFEHAIFFRESGVHLEGIGLFMASNATIFDDRAELPKLVAEAVRQRRWTPEYSRNLVVGPLRWAEQLIQYGDLRGRFLYVDILNRRPDVGAVAAEARLEFMQVAARDRQPSPNRSPLKVTGQAGAFNQTIWPHSHGAFDLLCVDFDHGSRIYLNNALDVTPRPVLLDTPGKHLLQYEVFAYGFERLHFCIQITTTERCDEATAELVPVSEPEL